jgi:uncharacterized phage protein (TIGR01671 family)
MREILFRGKRVDNGEWVYGDLQIQAKPLASILEYEQCYGYGNLIPVIPETVGQYTGLKDKNGINIFEGDIIKHINRNEIYTCVWVEDYACFAFIEDIEFGEGYYFQKVDEEKLSIIGNVCDNPDKINSKPQ